MTEYMGIKDRIIWNLGFNRKDLNRMVKDNSFKGAIVSLATAFGFYYEESGDRNAVWMQVLKACEEINGDYEGIIGKTKIQNIESVDFTDISDVWDRSFESGFQWYNRLCGKYGQTSNFYELMQWTLTTSAVYYAGQTDDPSAAIVILGEVIDSVSKFIEDNVNEDNDNDFQ